VRRSAVARPRRRRSDDGRAGGGGAPVKVKAGEEVLRVRHGMAKVVWRSIQVEGGRRYENVGGHGARRRRPWWSVLAGYNSARGRAKRQRGCE
jgi:hypothetical protein